MYPTISDYNTEIFKFGNGVLSTLGDYTFIPSRTVPVKIFSFGNGSYAVVFKATHNNNIFAIRCFISANPEVFWRYSRIDAYLKGINESWVTIFDFIDNEFKMKGGRFPVVKMDWIEGALLNNYISTHLQDNNALNNLQKAFVVLSESLERNKISHGDIQCGNVVIQGSVDNPLIKLIDYDGMYIPEFQNMSCLERGRSEFQHPYRTQMAFDEKIDRFSFWVIIAALEALKYKKDLWLASTQGGYNTLDNTLFVGSDFRNFNQSTLVNKLYSLNTESVNFYLNKLNEFCVGSSLNIEKPTLFDGISTTTERNAHSTEIKEININKPSLDVITIKSFPSGANVLIENHFKIGQTPLTLKKDTVINQRIILSYGTKIKLIQIDNDTTDIFHQFAEPELTNSFEPTILGPEDEETDYTVLAQSHPIKNPAENSKLTAYIWVGIIIIVGLIASFLYFKSNAKANSYLSSIDTINLPTSIDTTANLNISNSSLDSTISDNSVFELMDDNGNKPEDVARAFFYDLDNHLYEDAFNRTYNPVWEKKGLSWFVSELEYGGISSLILKSIINKNASINKASFIVSFKQIHIYDGQQCYNQVITLKKTEVFDNKNLWMITDVNNNIEPFNCD